MMDGVSERMAAKMVIFFEDRRKDSGSGRIGGEQSRRNGKYMLDLAKTSCALRPFCLTAPRGLHNATASQFELSLP